MPVVCKECHLTTRPMGVPPRWNAFNGCQHLISFISAANGVEKTTAVVASGQRVEPQLRQPSDATYAVLPTVFLQPTLQGDEPSSSLTEPRHGDFRGTILWELETYHYLQRLPCYLQLLPHPFPSLMHRLHQRKYGNKPPWPTRKPIVSQPIFLAERYSTKPAVTSFNDQAGIL